MERITPAASPYPPEVQAWLDRTMPAGKPPLRLFAILARDPRLFAKFFSGGLLDRGHLSLRQRELVIDRTTALHRSEYEWGVHVAIFGEKVGLTDSQVASLAQGSPDDPCWSDGDRPLLRLCDELHAGSDVSDATWDSLKRLFSDEAVIELLLLAGFYTTVSYLTNALRVRLEPDGVRFPSAIEGPARTQSPAHEAAADGLPSGATASVEQGGVGHRPQIRSLGDLPPACRVHGKLRAGEAAQDEAGDCIGEGR
ncbi:MAG: carboxymuconolactone decarboxylase family protein [Burkholderiaceae bacterium]|nr:carboxymuconolactone decarboxylase family protein [Burkholderiaceae bacterium]